MKTLLRFIIASLFATGLAACAQTNQFYRLGDLSLDVAPTALFPLSSAKAKQPVFGYDLQTIYWQTAHTGTGLKVGARDISTYNNGLIDHVEALEYFRAEPLPNDPIFARWSVNLSTGAETWLLTGAKGVELGLGTEWSVTKDIRLFLGGSVHFEDTAAASGEELTGGLRWVW